MEYFKAPCQILKSIFLTPLLKTGIPQRQEMLAALLLILARNKEIKTYPKSTELMGKFCLKDKWNN
ncbi:hypothetical protein NC651_006390 [Populus alba x Populus x berolinensis]|nr:hypothetical protein NC651_006390 [Populus alba x Populus x berolinensis]